MLPNEVSDGVHIAELFWCCEGCGSCTYGVGIASSQHFTSTGSLALAEGGGAMSEGKSKGVVTSANYYLKYPVVRTN